LDCLCVRDAQTGSELRLDTELLQHSLDLWAAAVYDDGINRRLFKQDDVLGKVARRLLLAHGVSAIFHHDDFLVIALHVRQRFGQDAGLRLRVDLRGFAHRCGLVRLPAVLADAAVPRQCISSFFPRAAGRWLRAARRGPLRHATTSLERSEKLPAAWSGQL